MRRAPLIIGSAAVLAVAAVAAVLGVGGSTRPGRVEITSSTVVQGHVVDAGGDPAADVDVHAELWPADVAGLKEGEPVPLHGIGTTRTDDDGRFAFALDPASVPAAFRNGGDDEGWVQFRVMVDEPGAHASWELPAFTVDPWATPDGAAPAWALRTDEGDLPPARVDIVLVVDGQSEVRILPQ